MDTETGTIGEILTGEKQLTKQEVEIRKPDPFCPVCHGKGSYLADVTRDPNYGNRAQRRAAKKRKEHLKYLPCPACAQIKKL